MVTAKSRVVNLNRCTIPQLITWMNFGPDIKLHNKIRLVPRNAHAIKHGKSDFLPFPSQNGRNNNRTKQLSAAQVVLLTKLATQTPLQTVREKPVFSSQHLLCNSTQALVSDLICMMENTCNPAYSSSSLSQHLIDFLSAVFRASAAAEPM